LSATISGSFRVVAPSLVALSKVMAVASIEAAMIRAAGGRHHTD
jgi:hypothetical protein